MTRKNHECIGNLVASGIDHTDATALRRISMTLRRWHELECGDGNEFASWCVVRGRKINNDFEYDDNGRPFIERSGTSGRNRYSPTADRETGAKKRLAAIMARYPKFTAYIQTDPRGAALFILRPGDVPEGKLADSYYSNGIAVY